MVGSCVGIFGAILSVIAVTLLYFEILVLGRLVCGIAAGIGMYAIVFYLKEIIPSAFSSKYMLTIHFALVMGIVSPIFLFSIFHSFWGKIEIFIMAVPILSNLVQLCIFMFVDTFDTP